MDKISITLTKAEMDTIIGALDTLWADLIEDLQVDGGERKQIKKEMDKTHNLREKMVTQYKSNFSNVK